MPNIKIIDKKDAGKPKTVPQNKDLSSITERTQYGRPYDLTLDKSFTRSKGDKQK